jgi:hypothetical protein
MRFHIPQLATREKKGEGEGANALEGHRLIVCQAIFVSKLFVASSSISRVCFAGIFCIAGIKGEARD